MPNIHGKQSETVREMDVTIGSGAASHSVTFRRSFTRTPHVTVVPHEADVAGGASYSATSVDDTGFTITISGSSYTDGDIEVTWIAVEKD